MVEAQGGAVEAALWPALKALEERGELLQRIADRMRVTGRAPSTRFRQGAREADERGCRHPPRRWRSASRRRSTRMTT